MNEQSCMVVSGKQEPITIVDENIKRYYSIELTRRYDLDNFEEDRQESGPFSIAEVYQRMNELAKSYPGFHRCYTLRDGKCVIECTLLWGNNIEKYIIFEGR